MNLLGTLGSFYMYILVLLIVIGFGITGLWILNFIFNPKTKGNTNNTNIQGGNSMNRWLRLSVFSIVGIIISMVLISIITPGGMYAGQDNMGAGGHGAQSSMSMNMTPTNNMSGGSSGMSGMSGGGMGMMSMPMNNMSGGSAGMGGMSGGGMGMMNMPMNNMSGGGMGMGMMPMNNMSGGGGMGMMSMMPMNNMSGGGMSGSSMSAMPMNNMSGGGMNMSTMPAGNMSYENAIILEKLNSMQMQINMIQQQMMSSGSMSGGGGSMSGGGGMSMM